MPFLKRTTIRRGLRLLVVLPVVWPLLAWAAAEILNVSSEPSHADAIVILAGSATYVERTHQAARLFKQGFAPKVILTNDGQTSGWSAALQTNPLFVERAAMELKSQGVSGDKIVIMPGLVSNTRDEAAHLSDYATREGLHSILVVTSAYQVRRARWTFNQIFTGSGITVSFSGVPPGEQSPRPLTWWLHRSGWRMVAGEYLKFVYYFVHGVRRAETATAAQSITSAPNVSNSAIDCGNGSCITLRRETHRT